MSSPQPTSSISTPAPLAAADSAVAAPVTAAAPARAKTASLSSRIVRAMLGFCLVFTVLVVAVRTWSAWTSNVAAMSTELEQIGKVYQRTLSKSIWDMDREALQGHVSSLADVPSIGQVIVSLKSTNGTPELFQHARAGWQPSRRAPVLRMTLEYEAFPGSKEVVGEFMLYGDEDVLWTRLRAEVAVIMGTQIIQSLLLASLITLMFSRVVTVHVRRVAQHLAQLTPSTLGQSLTLNRNPARRDELSLLVGGVNQLQSNLSDYLQRQQRYEQELADHRDHLAELVRERTGELEAANARLEDANALLDGLARTDPLTGLANRRHFDESKDVEFRRALRTRHPLSLLVCDIDYFKRYNDTYGHAVGDQCLRAVAGAIRASCARAGDLVARIGGEEFAVLLPATDAAHAAQLAGHILRAVAAQDIAHSASAVAPHVTVSIGLSQLDPALVDHFDTLFNQADKALYQAKSQGRNQVARYGESTDAA